MSQGFLVRMRHLALLELKLESTPGPDAAFPKQET